MMTQIEMDTMRAIISLSKEYRNQNMFVKIKGYFTSDDEVKVELIVRLKDVVGIVKGDGIVGVNLTAHNYSFIITEEEYKEKLQKYINWAV